MAKAKNVNYAIADAGSINLTRNSDGKHVLYSPYANSMNLAFTSSQLYAMANGSRAVRFDYGKEATMACSFEVFDLKWLSILLTDGTGGWIEGANEVMLRETFTIVAGNNTLDDAPVGGTVQVFFLAEDNVGEDDELALAGGAPAVGEYAITGSDLTFNVADEGKNVSVYGVRATAITTKSLQVPASQYPTGYSIDAVSQMKAKYNGVAEEVNIKIKNAVPKSEFTINFSETEVTTLDVEFDIFADENDNLVEFIREGI